MNPDVKSKWVNALESGEYDQTSGALRDNDGFCCLGVLCDLYSKENDAVWVDEYDQVMDYHTTKFLGQDCFLPEEVIDWAGLPDNNPLVVVEHKYNDVTETLSLSGANDGGLDFTDIAEIIREQL